MIPKFGAEASLYRSSRSYGGRNDAWRAQTGPRVVIPQQFGPPLLPCREQCIADYTICRSICLAKGSSDVLTLLACLAPCDFTARFCLDRCPPVPPTQPPTTQPPSPDPCINACSSSNCTAGCLQLVGNARGQCLRECRQERQECLDACGRR
jgi:hypothetical protein